MKYFNELYIRYPVLNAVKNDISEAYSVLENAYMNGKKLLICGNGGSAADAEHIVGELMKSFIFKRKIADSVKNKLVEEDPDPEYIINRLEGALPAIALTGHSSLSTAFSNDVSPDMVYAQQLYGYGCEGDVLIGLSTSGNSANVYNAVRVAKAKGIKTILISGEKPGKIARISDVSILLPEKETFKVQELTLPVYHALCAELEERFFA